MVKSPGIVVIGSLNLDVCLHVDHLPAPGETVGSARMTHTPGGKGANQAVACARLGAPTYMLGALGEDEAATLLRGTLNDAGVDTSALLYCPEPTGTAIILITPSGENSIVVAPGANHALTASHVEQQASVVTQAGMALVQLETPVAVLGAVLALAGPANVPVMLDPAPATPLPPELLQRLAWFTPNETEAAFYCQHLGLRAPQGSGSARAEALCRQFQAVGPANVLLKLGSGGAAARLADGTFAWLPAPPVNVVDTTGAGDICNAAFATALLRKLPFEDALRFAICAASLSVTRVGAMDAAPTRIEVEELKAVS